AAADEFWNLNLKTILKNKYSKIKDKFLTMDIKKYMDWNPLFQRFQELTGIMFKDNTKDKITKGEEVVLGDLENIQPKVKEMYIGKKIEKDGLENLARKQSENPATANGTICLFVFFF